MENSDESLDHSKQPIYSSDEERDEMGSEYRSPPRQNDQELRPRRNLRSSVEPELVMPASPNAASKQRASTPHMRLNQRSLTSDAGEIRKKTRSSTQRFRMGDRSLTSDAGKIKKGGSRLREEVEDEEDEEEEGYPSSVWRRVVRPLLGYVFSILGLVMQNLKPIFATGVVVYLLAAAVVFGSGFLTNSINHALSPICRLPFTSHLAFCPVGDRPELKGPAEFDKLVQAQDAFQDVLASTSVGANLPLDMKRSEASVRDLKNVVQYSSLPSRNELVFEFGGFIDTARQASQDLSKFNSRIGRAVDHILSTNRWTLSVIDGVNANEASRGAIAGWVAKNFNVFAPFQPISLSRNVLLDQYLRHTSAVEEQILSLINEALALRDILENLDGRLDLISGIVTRDDIRISTSKDELFATLWTKLGGNRSSVQKLNKQLQLLKDVNNYRRAAWGHVTATLLKLQEIQHSLEDLRERVAMPETVGAERVPLEVQIESINLGIERLEGQRERGRLVERENYRRVIGRGEGEGRGSEIEGGEREL
ncbi:hypothetical protein M409DRAFT_64493 [Zasmidium cellare ATCC 36951]|uniref:Uncharacterized protein n=1 Tax=Zasmidium cellare ATCC 36951 TaxID=1080233 RepID=A0A6A6CVB1_ZASCE|nr:uncharacterized protein M409DRAFT_64493 [Zasmidium cellare ATCC 36951]KAF2170140.1 hypothetical protein M409DRAFT_64493 [Zasmidium cellare ATCC 36951]